MVSGNCPAAGPGRRHSRTGGSGKRSWNVLIRDRTRGFTWLRRGSPGRCGYSVSSFPPGSPDVRPGSRKRSARHLNTRAHCNAKQRRHFYHSTRQPFSTSCQLPVYNDTSRPIGALEPGHVTRTNVRMLHTTFYTPFNNCFISISTCFLLSVVYIASLYIWKSQYDRNHPTTIKKRFLSVFIMMFISPLFLYIAIHKNTLQEKTLWEILGFRLKGLCQAIFMPLFLTMILFLGPLCMQAFNGLLKVYTEPMYWINNVKNLIWLRNHVVAPLSEEFTFRSCMLPALLECLHPKTAIVMCPFFFGVAHFHHMIERIKNGTDFKTAFLISCFHFFYTTIFGAYSAFLFYRTGHFASCFIAHAFCNHMGFPDIQELLTYKGKQKLFVVFTFILGFTVWCSLLYPLTEPSWYYNKIPS